MRVSLLAILAATVFGCGASRSSQSPGPSLEDTELAAFSTRLLLTLTHLDGRPIPTGFSDTRGKYTLNSGELILDTDNRLWLVLDLVGTGDYSSGPTGRKTITGLYRKVGADSLVFPADSTRVPEFFGRFRGSQLVLVASPTRAPNVVSLARENGGVHTWRFAVQ
jgi:hypothetical protein